MYIRFDLFCFALSCSCPLIPTYHHHFNQLYHVAHLSPAIETPRLITRMNCDKCKCTRKRPRQALDSNRYFAKTPYFASRQRFCVLLGGLFMWSSQMVAFDTSCRILTDTCLAVSARATHYVQVVDAFHLNSPGIGLVLMLETFLLLSFSLSFCLIDI